MAGFCCRNRRGDNWSSSLQVASSSRDCSPKRCGGECLWRLSSWLGFYRNHLVSQSASECKCHWTCVVWMSWGVIRLFLLKQICLIRSGSLRPWLLWAKNQSRQDLVPVVHGPSIGEEDGQGRSDRIPVLMCIGYRQVIHLIPKGLIEAIRV